MCWRVIWNGLVLRWLYCTVTVVFLQAVTTVERMSRRLANCRVNVSLFRSTIICPSKQHQLLGRKLRSFVKRLNIIINVNERFLREMANETIPSPIFHSRLKPFLFCKSSSCKDDCGWITQLKQQMWKRRYYLAAHRRLVNVLTSNSAFFIFAVSVVWFSHSRPYKMMICRKGRV